jgi:hypothetical protein
MAGVVPIHYELFLQLPDPNPEPILDPLNSSKKGEKEEDCCWDIPSRTQKLFTGRVSVELSISSDFWVSGETLNDPSIRLHALKIIPIEATVEIIGLNGAKVNGKVSEIVLEPETESIALKLDEKIAAAMAEVAHMKGSATVVVTVLYSARIHISEQSSHGTNSYFKPSSERKHLH